MKPVTGAVFALLFAGCSAVYVAVPIGDRPLDVSESTDELNGTWVNPEFPALNVKVEDATNGFLRVRYVDDEGGKPELSEFDVYLREGAGKTYASARMRASTNENAYLWFRFEKSERSVFLWLPDAVKFARLTDARVFPGTVEKERIPKTISFSATFTGGEEINTEKLFGNAVTNAYHESDTLTVRLNALSTNHLDLIASERSGVLFEWEKPIVFFKLSK